MKKKAISIQLAACFIFCMIVAANICRADDSKEIKGTLESAAGVVVKPVEVVTTETGKVVESGLETTGTIVFESLEAIKEGANEILPENMEFVGDEADREGKDSGPKIRMAF